MVENNNINNNQSLIQEEKISINELIDNYNNRKSEEAKNRYLLAKIKIVNYMPFEKICGIVDIIIENSMFGDNKNIKIDSCKKYLLYLYSLLYYYTNIEVHAEKWLEEFNLLNKNNMIENIIALIPEKIIGEFDAVLKMKTDDVITNYCTIQSYIDSKLSFYYPKLSNLIIKGLQTLENIVTNIDENKIKDYFSIILNQ